MEISLTLCFAAVLWQYNKFISLFLMWSFISMLYPDYSLISREAQGAVLIGCIWYFMLVHFVKDYTPLFNVMCAAALINLTVQCLQIIMPLLNLEFWLASPHTPVGFMANPNETGALYVFTMMAFIITRRYVGIPILMVGMFLANSKMGLMCLVVGGLIWLSAQDNPVAFSASVLGAVIILAFLGFMPERDPTNSLSVRFAMWGKTFPVILHYGDWHGIGIGHWKTFFLMPIPLEMYPTADKPWDMAHNDFFQVWTEMGIPGISLIILYLIDVYVKFKPQLVRVTVVLGMIAVCSFGSFPWRIAPLAMIALTWMAIYQNEETNIRTGNRKIRIRFAKTPVPASGH